MLEIRAPAEHSDGTRSQVLRWLKAVGERVREHEPLIELETDKVTVEIAAPGSGVLHEILKSEREEIEPGELLGRIETAEVAATSAAPESPVNPRGTAAASPRLSPAVRRLLQEHAVTASEVRGTGAGGRITADDVMRHVAAAASRGAVAAALDAGLPAPEAAVEAPFDEEPRTSRRVPHTAMRRRIAGHMVESLLHTAPHVTAVFEADLSAVVAHRARHRDEFAARGAPLTLTAYFLAACVDAIRSVPEANARWTDEAIEIFAPVHIGVATALGERGLVAPVLKHVERRDLYGIARELHALVQRAREGRLSPEDVQGGTFTVSNHGVSGSLLAAPIVIPQPQSASLGVGRLEKRAVVVEQGDEDRIVVQPRCYVTLTIDHRVMDGFQANRFLQTLVQRLESWPPDGE